MPIGKSNGNGAVAQTAPAPVAATLGKRVLETTTDTVPANPYEAKDRRILRQGVYQAVLQSPGLAALPFTGEAEFLKLVERVSETIINKVQG